MHHVSTCAEDQVRLCDGLCIMYARHHLNQPVVLRSNQHLSTTELQTLVQRQAGHMRVDGAPGRGLMKLLRRLSRSRIYRGLGAIWCTVMLRLLLMMVHARMEVLVMQMALQRQSAIMLVLCTVLHGTDVEDLQCQQHTHVGIAVTISSLLAAADQSTQI